MISPPRRRAISRLRLVLPTAVGPVMMTTLGLAWTAWLLTCDAAVQAPDFRIRSLVAKVQKRLLTGFLCNHALCMWPMARQHLWLVKDSRVTTADAM